MIKALFKNKEFQEKQFQQKPSKHQSSQSSRLANIKSLAISSVLCLSVAGAGIAHGANIAAVTKGSGAVNQLGGYNYQVPLQVAPGTMGLQPNLSLIYNSNSSGAGSILGTGWGMGGLSEIHRCGKTLAQDGKRGGVNFDDTDRLCKDGVRLVSSLGTGDSSYWSNSSSQYYHPVDEDWTKITASYSGQAISHLIVKTKDRQTLRYGYYSSSSNLYPYDGDGSPYGRYLLNQVTDRNGNVMNYNYAKTNETSRLINITYNNRKVEFEYSTTDTYNSQNGFSVALNPWESSDEYKYGYRLNTIKMSASNVIFKVYKLGYETSKTTSRYRLNKVEECTAVSGGDCIAPAMEFDYNDYDWEADFQKVTVGGNLHQQDLRGGHNGYGSVPSSDDTWVANGGANIIPGDWNGDGLSDFIRQEVSGAEQANGQPGGESTGTPWTNDDHISFGFYLSDGDGSFDPYFPNDLGEQSIHKGFHATAWGNSGFTGSNIIPGDFNGDGKLDYIRQEFGAIAEDYASSIRIYFNDGNDAYGRPTFFMKQPSQDCGRSGNDCYQTYLAGQHQASNGDINGATIQVGDFNGDGKSDFLRVEQGAWADNSVGSFQVFLANDTTDVDGNFTRIEPNDNNEQFDIRAQTNGDGARIFIGDFNGDGKDDFVRQEFGGWVSSDEFNTFNVYFSNGDGHFTKRTPTESNIQYSLKGPHGDDKNGKTLHVGDYNGDGKADIMAQAHGQWANDDGWNLQMWFSRGDGTFNYRNDSNPSFHYDMRGEIFFTTPNEDGWDNKPNLGNGTRLILGDYNADGRTDFIRQEMGTFVDNTYMTFSVYLSKGDGNWDRKVPTDTAFQSELKGMHAIQCNYNVNCAINSNDWFKHGVDIIPGDYDGDGKLDFISRQYGVIDDPNKYDFAVYFNPLRGEQPVDSLKKVHNGNAEWDISYDYLTQVPVTLVGSGPSIGADFMQIDAAFPVVTQVQIGTKNTSNIADQQILYTYGKPIAGKQSGFLGYTQMQETFVQRNKKIISDYTALEHNGVYVNMASNINTVVYPGAWQIISNVNHKYEQVSGSHSSTITRKTRTATTQYVDGTAVTYAIDFDYDAYSNVVRQVRTDGTNVTATGFRYAYDTAGDNWQIGEFDAKWLCDGTGSVSNGIFSCDKSVQLSATGLSYNTQGDLTQQRQYSEQYPSIKLLTTNYEYDSFGNRTKITDPNGTITAITYDASYDTYPISKTVDVGGKNLTETYQYDGNFGGMLQLTDYNGVVKKTNYDSLGRLASVEKEDPTGVLTTVEEQTYSWIYHNGGGVYDGDLLKMNRKVYTQWDQSDWYNEGTHVNVLGQKVYTSRTANGDFENLFSQWSYDANGRKVKELVPSWLADFGNLQYINYEYGADGRLNTIDMPDGEDTSYSYTANSADCNAVRSNLIKITITQGSRERYRCVNLSEQDEKVNISGDTGSVEHLSTRDKKGRLVSLSDGSAGNTTTFEYDLRDRQTKVDNAQRGVETYTFNDTTGLMTSWTHKSTDDTTVIGSATFGYDALGRKTSINYSDGKLVEFSYDSATLDNNAGRLSTATVKQNGVQTLYKEFAYDPQGNVKAKSVTIDGRTHLFAYGHSPQSKLTQMTYPTGRVIDYEFDGYAQIDAIKDGATVLADYGQYSSNGRYKSVSFNNGVSETRSLDSTHRLTDVVIDTLNGGTGVDLLNQTYSYNSYSEIATLTDNMGNDDLSYGYSDYGYVTQATGPWGTENYQYNANGDISYKNGKDYQYDSAGYLSSAGSSMYTFNKAGNLSEKDDQGKHYAYQYNAKGELTSVTTTASDANHNVALGKTATQSSDYNAMGVASKANDGNTNGNFNEGSVTHTMPDAGAWWQVDLGESHMVDQVILYNRTDCCSERLKNFNVEYLDASDNVIATELFAGTAGTTETFNLIANNVHKVRVKFNTSGMLQLAEVQVIGQPTNNTMATAVTTFDYDGNGNRTMKVTPDGNKVIYVDGAFELQDNGSQILATDYVMGPEGRVASFTVDASSGFFAATGASGSFIDGTFSGGNSLQHDMMANMMNTDTLAGTIGWATHTIASYVNHPNAAGVVYMMVILPLLFSLVMFMVHYIRSANPSSGLRKMHNRVVNAIGKAGWINGDSMARLQVQSGTEFMQEHRVLSLGAPIALVGMMMLFMPVGSAYAANGNPELGANATQYFHNDRGGNTILVTDASGNQISKPVYKPFGEVYSTVNNNGDDDSYRYGFAGKETDGDIGLMYFGNRYYDPSLGRFITADSAGIGSDGYRAAQLNRYAFSQNDPINMADPSGNLAFLTMVLIAFIVSATVSTAAELITAKVQNRAVNWTTIGIGIAVSAIMAPIGIGLGMGVAKAATMLGTTRLGAASMYMSMSLVNAGVSPGVVTGAATAATAVIQTAVASAAYSGISQGFGMAFDSEASWSWRAFGLDIAFDVVFLGASYTWNNKITNSNKYLADMESNSAIRKQAVDNANFSSNGRSLNRDLALQTIKDNDLPKAMPDYWKNVHAKEKLRVNLKRNHLTNAKSASADQFARAIEAFTPTYLFTEELTYQFGDNLFWTIKNETKRQLNQL